jgi:hypothetical protein
VTTDNLPIEFRYISRRLVTEIVQQHEAGEFPVDRSWTVQLKVLGVTVKKRRPDYHNVYDLANRATKAVENFTGTIEAGSPYVRDMLDLHTCVFPVYMGWEEAINVEIAALVADDLNDGERTFVALVGSASNFIGRAPSTISSGWFPSDADGLYHILATTSEPGEPSIERYRLDDEDSLSEIDRIESALRIVGDAQGKYPSRRLEFLAKVHLERHGVTIRGERFVHVIVGAPIWAAVTSATSRADSVIATYVDCDGSGEWPEPL